MSTATLSAPLANATPSKAPSASPLDFAVQQILAKQRKQAIVSQLSAQYCLSAENALAVVNQAYALKHAAFRKAGVKILVTGIAMLFFGILITAGTYSMVSDKGGTYVVTYGLIAVGVIRILQGLFKIAIG